MYNTRQIVAYLLIVITMQLCAQGTDSLSEENIKLSGDYFWDEAYSPNKQNAITQATDKLMGIIADSVAKNTITEQVKEVITPEVRYLYFSWGQKTQAIAFVEKARIQVIMEKNKALQYFPIKISHEKNAATEDVVKTPTAVNKKATELDSGEKAVQPPVINGSPNIPGERQKSSSNKKSDRLRSRFSAIQSSDVLLKELENSSDIGDLSYGNQEDFNNPAACDIIIMNSDARTVEMYIVQNAGNYIDFQSGMVINDFMGKVKGKKVIWLVYFD
ncbi:MAG: hypothetical protein LWX56_02440 [Ignavibacteria bacterium]|nr:hypothetical protein [Ignavibacteria bacterium]